MIGIDAYIYIVISLLGVAYPLLLQVIARLDEKYSSDNIVSLFDKEIEGKLFKYSLITSLILVLIWSLKLEPISLLDSQNFLINNSASILLALSTVLLVVAFFFFVNKILIYYTPSKFIQYLRQKHSESKGNLTYFEALSDILLLSIKNQQKNIALTLSEFFYTAFRVEREKFKSEPIIYPDLYYEVVYKSIEELAILKEKRNYSLEHRTAGGIWLLGELQSNEVSELTFTWIWRNLLLVIKYEQDDMIIYHWETAHQFYSYSLTYIYENYEFSPEELQVSNEDEVKKRIAERGRFIEFHYALGGLLTYKQRYNCIIRLFNHTNSEPPKYELLPESMNEIFKFYFKIRDPFDREYSWISHLYPFPEQSGIKADYVIKKWICSYMAILFLRQYTINPYLITMAPLEFPSIPSTQGEIKEWIDGLDFFKQLVSEHLTNAELMEKLNFKFITHQWCSDDKKLYPLDFIDTLKENLSNAYHINAITLPISEDKVIQFETSTKSIIEAALDKFEVINNSGNIGADTDKWYVNGGRILQNKDAFSENPESHYMDFDSFLASITARNIDEGITSTFFFKKLKSYLLKQEDIFSAIDKMKLNKKYVIIGFGFNLDYYINQIKVPDLNSDKYQDIDIYLFSGSRLVNSSLFILKKSDLPIITTKPISQELIEKYTLKKISDNLNLYTSVIDLNNTTDEILEENKQGKEEVEIRKSVLQNITISTEILWKKNIEVIQLVEYSEYKQKGLPNNLKEIKPTNKKMPSK